MPPYIVPYVRRCKKNIHGDFPDEGYDVVGHGIIELNPMEMKIYDGNGYEPTSSLPVLCIRLTSITAIDFTRFRSLFGNFRGGAARIDAVFVTNNKKTTERLTLKMPLDEYSRFRNDIKELLQ